ILPIFFKGDEIDRIIESWISIFSFWPSNSSTLSGSSSISGSNASTDPPNGEAPLTSWWKSPVAGVAAAYISSDVEPFAERKCANSSSARNTDEGERTAFVVQLWTAANFVKND